MATTRDELSPEAQAFLKALASPTRQAIMWEFADGELTVTEVAERLGLAQSAASTHLATLRDAGLLISRREWKTVHYRPDPAAFLRSLEDLRGHLLACCPPAETDTGGDD
ncbi:DNA-binding transcriptional ArsR family regulator [Stackebrandtia albiflava]|uniref:DNA-binding transcriptional ArsR family regulator n=1 Tax=Stackebrandtia albiflava TaxID=406432 RepID=A0A562V9C8_9ACTN|nr:metalloregulator ArsR/SmtB family transcription factor [Stackebrandtia albiflava]TWJ14499.1 DNA-binding transcriptional ArsR family regulator [Stackebrandtia albiflava]